MPSTYGRKPYSTGPYSRDRSQGVIVIDGQAQVIVRAVPPGVVVQVTGSVSIQAAASVDVTGRLLWEHIAVAPCEGTWQPLVVTPCARAA